ncbi:MAG: FtsQ-type POTRA domain-containing protein [Verrucomicrobia bacterium]|jgi:cell division protein FtsQ|nr:FtsQ-type POTRA domain-containing protein [Verrucomicrobiota bacterium]
MWWRKKKQNKRHARHNVLDVKLRSEHVRAMRARGLVVMLGVLLGTVFTLYVLWRSGEWLLNRLVYENRAFAIEVLEVHTDGRIAVDQLARWSGVQTGQNLMALDLERVKSNLELAPNIHSVSVERLLPRTLRIRVMERKPIARVSLPRLGEGNELVVQSWLLDGEGAVMLPLEANQRQGPADPAQESCPALTGVSPTDLRLGQRVESSHLQAALRLIDAFNHSGMGARVRLTRVDLGEPGVLVAQTDAATQVTFGCEGFDAQLLRWQEIHEQSLRMRKTILSLDLAVKNNVPVRWMDSDAAPAGRST